MKKIICLLVLLFIPCLANAQTAWVTQTYNSYGLKLYDFTISNVAASTTSAVMPLTITGMNGRIINYHINSTTSTDYDFTLYDRAGGNSKDIIINKEGINLYYSRDDLNIVVNCPSRPYIKIKNDDGANATGVIRGKLATSLNIY